MPRKMLRPIVVTIAMACIGSVQPWFPPKVPGGCFFKDASNMSCKLAQPVGERDRGPGLTPTKLILTFTIKIGQPHRIALNITSCRTNGLERK